MGKFLSFLEVLIVFAVLPVATPSESFFLEKAIAQVAPLNHVCVFLTAVEIGTGCGWFYYFFAISQSFVVGVVEWVDVYSHSSAVL